MKTFFYEKKHLYPVYSFILTAILFLILLGTCGILGYGNNTILSGDLFSQYIAFIQSFLHVLKGEGNFYYSFSIFLGNPAVASYAYYCLSPFNLLYLIPGISVSAMTLVIILLKLSLAAATFQIYLSQGLKINKYYSILFSTAYALCTFAVSMFVHIMWLDALYTLPILLLLLIKFIKGSSFLPLVPAYAYLFITNFYMGYIVGIFSAICFLALLIIETEKWDRANIVNAMKRVFLYTFSVLLAAACCAAILLPAAYELLAQNDTRSVFSLQSVTIPDVLCNLFIGEMQGMGSPIPLIYCGIPVILLIFVFFSSHSIRSKEKIAAYTILLFYLAGSQFLPIYKFLHAMEAPNWYAHRYAFCIVFILLSISCRAVPHIEEVPLKKLISYTAIVLAAYTILIPFQALCYPSYHINSHGWLILNACFLCLYLILIRFRPKRLALCLTLLLSAELLINGHTCITRNDFGYHSEDMVNQWKDSEGGTIPSLQAADPSFYRIRVNGETNFNAPSYFHYAGLNSFSSIDNTKLRETLSSLGIATSFMCIYDHGYTDLTDMLFGVKYSMDINTKELNGSPLALPVGYMCSPSLLAWQNGADAFANQENLVNLMTGSKYSFYQTLDIGANDIITKNIEIMPFENVFLFQHITDMAVNGMVSFRFPEQTGKTVLAYFPTCDEPIIRASSPQVDVPITGYMKSTNLSDGNIIYATHDENGIPEVNLLFSENGDYDYAVESLQFRSYDNSALSSLRKDLGQHSLEVEQYSDGYLSGIVEATAERPLLFLSIPYSEGWQALVDDTPTPVLSAVNDSFISLYLTPGTHKIQLQYNHPYAIIGNMISCGAFITLLLLLLLHRKKSASTLNKAIDESAKGESA